MEKLGGEAQKRAVGSRWVGMQTKDREDDGGGVYEGLRTRGNGRGCGGEGERDGGGGASGDADGGGRGRG
jgi:hypothetical protein